MHNVKFHVANSWQRQDVMGDSVPVSWITDHVRGSYDCISAAALLHVGDDKVIRLATQLKEAGLFWQAAVALHIVAMERFKQTNEHGKSIPVHKLCLAELAKIEFGGDTPPDLIYARDIIQLRSTFNIMNGWHPDDHALLQPTLPALRKTQACVDDQMTHAGFMFMTRITHAFFDLTPEGWKYIMNGEL